jgi:hypothetical protein
MELFMNRGMLFAILSALVVINIGCQSNNSSRTASNLSSKDANALASDVGAEFEVLGRTAPGNKGAPILLLEERHDSRAGQIQHAITLVRLHEKYAVNDIGLEGYLKDGPPLDTSWVARTARTQDPLSRARVLSRLLREGEISSAEFVQLVYDNVQLLPAETRQQYDVNLSPAASVGPLLYLPELAPDTWTQQQTETYNNQTAVMAMRGEEHLAVAQEIERRAQQQNIHLSPTRRKAWDEYMTFWQGRVGASKSMVDAASAAADEPNVAAFPIVIGSFHTQEMADKFVSEGRPIAVLTPAAIKSEDNRGDLSDKAFNLKYGRKSVFSSGLGNTLVTMFPPKADAKKPRPVVNEPWMQAKSEIYFATYRLVHQLLGSDGPPSPPNDHPPYGLVADDFRGRWTAVGLSGLEILRDKDGRSVVFPITIGDDRQHKTLWIKAALQTGQTQGATIEEILRSELDEVQTEGDKMRPTAEDELGRVRMGTDVIAVISSTQAGARRAILSNS